MNPAAIAKTPATPAILYLNKTAVIYPDNMAIIYPDKTAVIYPNKAANLLELKNQRGVRFSHPVRFFREKYLKPHFGNVSWEGEL